MSLTDAPRNGDSQIVGSVAAAGFGNFDFVQEMRAQSSTQVAYIPFGLGINRPDIPPPFGDKPWPKPLDPPR